MARFHPVWCGRSVTSPATCSVRACSFPRLVAPFRLLALCVLLALFLVSLSLSLSLSLSFSLAPCCAAVYWPWAPGASVTNSSNSFEHNSARHLVSVMGLGLGSNMLCNRCGHLNCNSRLSFVISFCDVMFSISHFEMTLRSIVAVL